MDDKMVRASRLFWASCIALIVTAMSFAIRGDIMSQLKRQFEFSNEDIGWINGTAFWGFTLAMIFGGPLCDVVGMGRLLIIAFFAHLLGITMTIFATGFSGFFMGTLAIGLANGFVEAACNPLVATLYPNDKTHKLNQFHVWFPGGIVIGGLAAFAISRLGDGSPGEWKLKMCTMFIPTLIYGSMFLGVAFPKTERVKSGVSTPDMFRACTSPLFIVLVCCMLLSAATELGTNQFITDILKGKLAPKPAAAAPAAPDAAPAPAPAAKIETPATVPAEAAASSEIASPETAPAALAADSTSETSGAPLPATAPAPARVVRSTKTAPVEDNSGILVLVWISGLMAVGRQFAGPIVHRLSPTGMLLFSAVFSTAGLLWLSFASSKMEAFGAATIFSIGICYFWPTMIGLTSERLPKSGALGMAIMGGAGMLSVSIVLPIMGRIYDNASGELALRYMSALPAVLIVAFAILYAIDLKKGGYRAEKIGPQA